MAVQAQVVKAMLYCRGESSICCGRDVSAAKVSMSCPMTMRGSRFRVKCPTLGPQVQAENMREFHKEGEILLVLRRILI